jgi:hypothetical protein
MQNTNIKLTSIFYKTPSQSKLSEYSPSKLVEGSSINNSFERQSYLCGSGSELGND